MASALAITDLIKTYPNGVEALKGVSLDVAEGDFFGLLGPNGAGKTTIIGIVTGLTNKTSGQAAVFGHSIDTDLSRAKSFIGLVPQEFNFNIFDSVLEILVTQAGYYGIPRTTALASSKKYLKKLGLWEKRMDMAKTLSGGMKRRLMIARALVHEPKLLILDEPTAGVDIELRRGMWDFLRELNTSGKTIILTTHYLEEAEQLCRNIVIINQGDIVANGSVKELLGGLSEETFVFDLMEPLTEETERSLLVSDIRKVDDRTVEMIIARGESLNEAMRSLDRLGIRVESMRNKSNRLEELFVRLTARV